jgi:hypothetical protein
MRTHKDSLNFLITPNYAAPYDQRMVNGLANGFHNIGHQALALPAPVSPIKVAQQCKEHSIDVVIQVNRTRDPNVDLPPNVRHISWFQDVFPESMNGFEECFRESDILYALGDPYVLGLNAELCCYVGSLVTGVDKTVLDYRKPPKSNPVDFSLCGFIPPPLPRRRSIWRFLRPGSAKYSAPDIMIKTVQEVYCPLSGALDIHELAAALYRNMAPYQNGWTNAKHRVQSWLSVLLQRISLHSGRDLKFLPPYERSINYFTREYPRQLDRVVLIEKMLEISNSLELYGPGWAMHPNFRPYAKGVIDTQEELLDVYCRSRINLANNTHGLGLHSRTLECMAVGGFIFTHESPHDNKPGGMLTSFEPGVHFGVFTPENLIDEASHWLMEDKKRIQAGLRAAEVIRDQHGWHHRAIQICKDLQK